MVGALIHLAGVCALLAARGAAAARSLAQLPTDRYQRVIRADDFYIDEDLDFDVGTDGGVVYDIFHQHSGGATVAGMDFEVIQDVGVDEGDTFASVLVRGAGVEQGLEGLRLDTGNTARLLALGGDLVPFQARTDADYDISRLFSDDEAIDIGTDSGLALGPSELAFACDADDVVCATQRRRLAAAGVPDVVLVVPAETLVARGGGVVGLAGGVVGGVSRALGGLAGVTGSRITNAAELLAQIRGETRGANVVDVILVGRAPGGGAVSGVIEATRRGA